MAGGASKGAVKIDVLKNENQYMTIQEASETVIFEFNNASMKSNSSSNLGKHDQIMKELGDKHTLYQCGIKCASAEYPSTKMVAKVLQKAIAKVNYKPSPWGKGQIENSDIGPRKFLRTPTRPQG